MTDVLTIRDAIVTKIGAVAGIKRAYSLMPDALPDGPVAVVVYDGTDVITPQSFEVLEHQYTAELYVASQSPAVTEKTLLPMAALVIAEFRTGRSLGLAPANVACLVARVDPVDTVEINGRGYDRLPVRFRVTDTAAVTVGI